MACATLKRSLEMDPLQTPRAAKRRRYGHFTTSPSIPPTRDATLSPFAVAGRISTETITANIREEMRRLNRRKQLYFGDSGAISNPGSPSSSNHDLLGETAGGLLGSRFNAEGKDKPLFTFRQVGMICERMMRERENDLRETYEQVLAAKLAEQYDQFVKFTHDQIQKRFEATAAPSYLS